MKGSVNSIAPLFDSLAYVAINARTAWQALPLKIHPDQSSEFHRPDFSQPIQPLLMNYLTGNHFSSSAATNSCPFRLG